MFWGGEVSGGHLSAQCLLVSMLSTGGAGLSSSSRIMASGNETGGKRAEGEGEERKKISFKGCVQIRKLYTYSSLTFFLLLYMEGKLQ